MFKVSRSGYSAIASHPRTESKTRSTGGFGTDSKRMLQGLDERLLSTSAPSMRVTTSPNTTVSGNAIIIDMEPMLTGLVPSVERVLYKVYKDIYYNESVAGCAVDLISTLPFSEFTLGGLASQKGDMRKVHHVYQETLERLNLRTLLPEIAVDYLVLGAHCSSLLYNKGKRIFTDVLPHSIENLTVEPLPFYSQDPIITVKFPAELTNILRKTSSPRIQRIREHLGQTVIDKILTGGMELDPLSTIFIPRRTFSQNDHGTSYLRRILPIYLIEKNLYRGTLVESARRQRGILHLTLGDGETWIPTVQDMEFITELFMCLSGDTLIHTNKGLVRIDEICDRTGLRKDTGIDINLRVKGADGKMATATKWWYRGYADTYKVTAEYGYSVTGTKDHRILVVDDSGPTWKKIKDLSPNDYVCVDTKPQEVKTNPVIDVPTLPKRMSVQLAYAMGLILSKGDISSSGIKVTDTNIDLLTKYVQCLKSIGIQATIQKVDGQKAGSAKTSGIGAKDTYVVAVGNRLLVRYFNNVGIRKADSADKCVPAIILSASTECQAAFLAGMVDGSGSLVNNTYRIHSVSATMRHQLQVLVSNLGILANCETEYPFVSFSEVDSQRLANRIDPYLACKEKRLPFQAHYCCKAGVPIRWLIAHLRSRYVGNVHGEYSVFRNDAGKETWVYTKDAGLNRFINSLVSMSELSDDKLSKDSVNAVGSYSEVLALIKRVSPSAYHTFQELMNAGYTFLRVVQVEHVGKQHVYDLTIKGPSKPAFVANGIVVHNSADSDPLGAIIATRSGITVEEHRQGGDFWKSTDFNDSVLSHKLRALGISEAFLSGDASYSTGDAALSVFIDTIRNFRDMMTRKLFYNKLFPLISLINGFTTKNNRLIIQEDLISQMTSEEALTHLNDNSRLFIPSVHWHKQLKPEGDSQYIDLLNSLTEKGVPVPLRALAAAGGLDLDMLIRQQDEDVDMRKRVAEYLKKISELAPKPEGGESMSSDRADAVLQENDSYKALASADPSGKTRSSVLASGGKVSILNRDFSHVEPYRLSKTNKPLPVFDRPSFERRANERILKALRNFKT